MRVAHLDTGPSWRGGQNQIALLLQGFARRGVECMLLAPPGPLAARAREWSVPVREWRPRGDLDLPALLAARRALAAWRPDVVHLHDGRAHALGAPAARLAGVRAIVASRRVAFPPRHDLGTRLKYRLPVERWLCVSEAARATLLAQGVAPERARVVPSGVDLEGLAARAREPAPDLRAMLGVSPETPLLATVGALTREKGHEVLLEVAARLMARAVHATMVWIGDGPLRDSLECARRERKLPIALLGQRDDAPALLRQCTLSLVASHHEGFSGAAIEAQALGIPVLATRVGGLPEAVADGASGLLVPPGDAATLSDAVAELLANPARRLALARQGPTQAARFGADLMVERTLLIYQELVRSGPGA